MNKFWKYTGIIAVFVAVFAFVGAVAVFAQGPNQPDSARPGGTNQMQRGASADQNLMSVDETAMHTAIADALDMSLDEFEAAVAAGETPFTLAEQSGIDFAEVQAVMDAAHEAAFAQAVADGLMSQEQADWILSHRGGAAGQSGGMGNSQTGNRGGNSQGANNAGHSHSSTGGGTGDCVNQTP